MLNSLATYAMSAMFLGMVWLCAQGVAEGFERASGLFP